MKQCKECNILKSIDDFECTTKDGKCRRAVCKPCYARKKADRAREAAMNHDQSSVPKPTACTKCGKGPDEVDFKWRSDIKQGGWRTECNSCFNAKGYSQKSRAKRLEEDPEGYRKRNADTHLAWAKRNPEKIKAQQTKQATEPDRKIKSLIQLTLF